MKGGGGGRGKLLEDTHIKATVMFVECKTDATSFLSKAEYLLQSNYDSVKRTRYISIYSVDPNSLLK